jgi:hypothetical protein
MNRTYHKFLILFTIFILFGGLYLYFSNSIESEAALSSSLDSSLPTTEGVSSDEKINSDIAFITTLASLTKIKIDTTLFYNKSFQNLNDNTVKLEVSASGRLNPFAPIEFDAFGGSTYISPVTTNDPLEIKSKTAVLSGVTKETTGVSSAYFEYGLTEALGQKTSQATVSLIGTFISNVTNLSSQTTYFYKACAKINGATHCGDIVSFYTN